MTNCIHVLLRVTDFGDDPDVVTKLIGIPPTECWLKGQPRRNMPATFHNYSSWQIQSSLPETAPMADQFEDLLTRLESKKNNIRAVSEQFKLVLLCAAYYHDCQPGIYLDRAVITRIADLGLSLDFDLYFLGDEPSKES